LNLKNSEAAKRIKSLILTIEDLKYIEGAGIKTILSSVDKGKLVVAFKGVSESLKEIFFHNMSERAAKLLKDEIIALDMVKIRTVYEAQQEIVSQAKELIRKGEIHLNKTLLNKKV
jgi:flagellar motor switch protein FliG